jgi:hypothetical protein
MSSILNTMKKDKLLKIAKQKKMDVKKSITKTLLVKKLGNKLTKAELLDVLLKSDLLKLAKKNKIDLGRTKTKDGIVKKLAASRKITKKSLM